MHKTCYEFIFEPQKKYDEDFLTLLEINFDVVSINLLDDGKEQAVAYSEEKIDFVCELKYEVKKLESENWLKDYVIKFKAFSVENFMIYGQHQKKAPKTNKTLLQIYAATAFGSNHPTTVMCIKHICDLHKQGFNPKSILDMGTGSGLLSLVASKLWPNAKITACDIDEEAVIVTRGNFENNNIKQAEVFQSDGYENVTNKFDLILANILANPLIEMAEDAYKHINKDGYIVLSGFNGDQTNWVAEEYTKQGFIKKKQKTKQGWRALLCMS
ncbi:MAG: 50S ribosomal protein L11 methyltransferase [Alphaproteobacteria bacterium]